MPTLRVIETWGPSRERAPKLYCLLDKINKDVGSVRTSQKRRTGELG